MTLAPSLYRLDGLWYNISMIALSGTAEPEVSTGAAEPSASSPSLDTNVITARKRKRAYQRIISGMQKKGQLRFLTLTSSVESPADFQRSFRKLRMRLLRRGLFVDYIRVNEFTKGGLRHEHILWRGDYISQAYMSNLWGQIHRAEVVWIKQVNGRKRLAAYLAKYMSKESCGRFSYSWGWVYKGFCRRWSELQALSSTLGLKFYQRLNLWRFMVWNGRAWSDMVLTEMREQVYFGT